MFCSPSTMVSSRSRLSFEEKHVRKLPCIPGIVYWKIYEHKFSIHELRIDELQKHMFLKKPVYWAKIVRYALLLRYTSIQSYQMLLEHFLLPPSLSLLRMINSGTIDAVKCAQTLKNGGKTSNVCLMFHKMYLQKCEEYFAGDLMGCNSEGELYKGLVCFMIVGLKNSIPYVIKLSPETKINGDWLKEELIDCLGILP